MDRTFFYIIAKKPILCNQYNNDSLTTSISKLKGMRHSKVLLKLFYSLVIISLAACGGSKGLPYSLDQGKIMDDFDITFTDKAVAVKQGELFSLAIIGLKASKKAWKYNAIETQGQHSQLADDDYPFYNITITKKGFPKYYGRIVFFNLSKANKDEALARGYYQLKIAPQSFEKAKGGRIEYASDAEKPTGKKASKKSLEPKWIIWLSDSPL